jgi:hypothetical protein
MDAVVEAAVRVIRTGKAPPVALEVLAGLGAAARRFVGDTQA